MKTPISIYSVPLLAGVLALVAVTYAGKARASTEVELAEHAAATDTASVEGSDGESALPATAKPRLDVELDPLAFALNGFSVHAGLRVRHFRFDVGAFGAELPAFMLSDDAFSSRFSGFGVKFDYHLRDRVGGPFVGLSAGRVINTVIHEPSGLAQSRAVHEVSARVGYEFDLVWGLYVVPWVSVGASFGSREVTVDDDTLEARGPITVFPTVHLGYRR